MTRKTVPPPVKSNIQRNEAEVEKEVLKGCEPYKAKWKAELEQPTISLAKQTNLAAKRSDIEEGRKLFVEKRIEDHSPLAYAGDMQTCSRQELKDLMRGRYSPDLTTIPVPEGTLMGFAN